MRGSMSTVMIGVQLVDGIKVRGITGACYSLMTERDSVAADAVLNLLFNARR